MTSFLEHIGVKRRSGRYKWGSGKDPHQRSNHSFLSLVDELRSDGLSDEEIAAGFNMKPEKLRAKLRARKTTEKAEKRAADHAMALRLKDKGFSNVAIGERMGLNESSVRALLDPVLHERSQEIFRIADVIKKHVDEKNYVDVGAGVEPHLNVTRTKMDAAVSHLEDQGYSIYYLKVKQQFGAGKNTSMKVLAKPGITYSETYANKDKIGMVIEHFNKDTGKTDLGIKTPVNVSSKRIFIRGKDEGGELKDGVIELRRGVPDLSMGKNRYSQVRVAVDGTHYMKGMAIYSEDIPDGFDIVYNTNKHRDDPKVFKAFKKDQDNPFGSTIHQMEYIGKDGKSHQSPLNLVNEEGDWGEWSKSISSQVLSKQRPFLAKKQLDAAFEAKVKEYDEIMSLTNPTIKKHLLLGFAEDCDASAVELKAAPLPRQANQVLLPVLSIKEHEVYAPNFNNGEVIVLIRHPHGGIFEIPELIVNNKNKEAKSIIGDSLDAIGIHPKVAAKLSGADFDGDTALAIPNPHKEIATHPSLKELKNFNPKEYYPYYEGMTVMTEKQKQQKMGDISNLITDMTIKGAPFDEIARAVKHSMVVIDAVKHELNYKESFTQNGIAELKKKYQGGERAGAATIVSRAGSQKRVPHRTEEGQYDPIAKKRLKIDPVTGKKLYRYTGESYTIEVPDKKGRFVKNPVTGKKEYLDKKQVVIERKTTTTKMDYADDARTLSSGKPIENLYADYANNLKALANKARLDYLKTGDIEKTPSARKAFEKEVASLEASLKLAYANKPLERRAQLLAGKILAAKKELNPDMDKDELKKKKGQALMEARNRVGAEKQDIKISEREWEAIQSGAVTKSMLQQIVLNTDQDRLKQLAMPRAKIEISPTKMAKARAMRNSGKTSAEIAMATGVSVSTINQLLADN